jgi:anti-sigma factor RsiW
MSVPADDLPCQELVELVTDYLESRLSEPERRRFDEHLLGCSGCRTYLEQMRLTIESLGGLSQASLDSAMRERLQAAFRAWRGAD